MADAPTEHQFKPGSAVYIVSGYGESASYYEANVHKVHKSGRFTIGSRPGQQWRAGSDGKTAIPTGRKMFNHERVLLVTPEVKARKANAVERTRRNSLLWKVRDQLQYLKTDADISEFVDELVGVLKKHGHWEVEP